MRSRGIARQTLGERYPRRQIRDIEEPQNKLRIIAFILGGVRRALQIEICQNPQQCRTHVDLASRSEINEILKLWRNRNRLDHACCAFPATPWKLPHVTMVALAHR